MNPFTFVLLVLLFSAVGIMLSALIGLIRADRAYKKREKATAAWAAAIKAAPPAPLYPMSYGSLGYTPMPIQGKLIIFGDGGVLLAISSEISYEQHLKIREELEQWRLRPSEGLVITGVEVEILRPGVGAVDVIEARA